MATKTTLTWEEFLAAGEESQTLVIDTIPGFSLDLKELYSA
jgi:hypothetical protein